MSRSAILLSFATLSLLVSCVDLRLPSNVSKCEQNNSCTDGTGGATGGKSGATGGSGGSASQSRDAGGGDLAAGGRGGSSGTGGTGGVGGSTMLSSGGTGGTGGSSTGGTSGSPDAGPEPTPDASPDKPIGNPDTIDTKPDILEDTGKPGTEAGPPDSLDAPLDLPPDRAPDLADAAFDAPSCIQNFKSSGYSVTTSGDGGIKACSECKTSGGNSLETPCKGMVDCLVTSWVCNSRAASCWTNCRNTTPNADMVVDDCVAALVSKACPR